MNAYRLTFATKSVMPSESSRPIPTLAALKTHLEGVESLKPSRVTLASGDVIFFPVASSRHASQVHWHAVGTEGDVSFRIRVMGSTTTHPPNSPPRLGIRIDLEHAGGHAGYMVFPNGQTGHFILPPLVPQPVSPAERRHLVSIVRRIGEIMDMDHFPETSPNGRVPKKDLERQKKVSEPLLKPLRNWMGKAK